MGFYQFIYLFFAYSFLGWLGSSGYPTAARRQSAAGCGQKYPQCFPGSAAG
ncbi:hypothetical protein H6B10_16810 [Gemmiger formicilis]|nr:hypothetical protein [Gemmiger formicilis]